jgi:uncharacterized phage-associated protein
MRRPRKRSTNLRNWRHAVRDRRHLMPVSAHDVADELRRRLGDVGAVKLQKLLYYAQGWHIAHTGAPMFKETIKAWAKGPVVADVWADEAHERGRPVRRALDDASLATLEYVIERYGALSGRDLIRMTHDEGPWRDVSESDDSAAPENPEITHEALARWFRNDEQYKWFQNEVDRLRKRTDIYSFGPLERTPDLEAAVARAQRGERVRHTRPG